jgi:peptide/nickel transport system permease protein
MDIFSRTIFAIRTDFALALSSVVIGIVIGVPLGAMAGYAGGLFDNIITRTTEVFQGFPQILFGMAVLAAAGNTLTNVVLIIAFYNVPVYSKMVRSVGWSLSRRPRWPETGPSRSCSATSSRMLWSLCSPNCRSAARMRSR